MRKILIRVELVDLFVLLLLLFLLCSLLWLSSFRPLPGCFPRDAERQEEREDERGRGGEGTNWHSQWHHGYTQPLLCLFSFLPVNTLLCGNITHVVFRLFYFSSFIVSFSSFCFLCNTKLSSRLFAVPPLHHSPSHSLSLFISECHCHKSTVVWTKRRVGPSKYKESSQYEADTLLET